MEMNGFMGTLYSICEWIMRLAYVNLLWIGFTVLGLIIFGFGPATAAMFAVNRKWVRGEPEVAVFKTFWSEYKREFVRANILGVLLLLVGFILWADFRILNTQDTGSWGVFVQYFLIVGTFIYGTMTMFFFPVFVHYDLKLFQYFKQTLLIAISRPGEIIMMIAGVMLIAFIMQQFPGLILFFSGSGLAFVVMWCANRAFTKIELKAEALRNKEQESQSA
ncbi:YesL family protein [Aureibacillus halotolerans]|uniref:Putative membrane protein YesL n=1 Tax=Aureibacillus halotolerans TaxID=1508390 RepID=A0A4R6UAZ7_9BACI|nr:YesL family protein [Aureibacillus halotolerans]TDQ42233.1 putative membrane protein YesL [Aureibacillus halotolerans]